MEKWRFFEHVFFSVLHPDIYLFIHGPEIKIPSGPVFLCHVIFNSRENKNFIFIRLGGY
jgi:hypothetical protein